MHDSDNNNNNKNNNNINNSNKGALYNQLSIPLGTALSSKACSASTFVTDNEATHHRCSPLSLSKQNDHDLYSSLPPWTYLSSAPFPQIASLIEIRFGQ
jgi:hypothetical protein